MTRRGAVRSVLAVVALAVAACGGAPKAAPPSSVPSTTAATAPTAQGLAVDVSATPAGWVPVDDGDAQLSVPATWFVSLDGCAGSDAPGTIIVDRQSPPATVFGCPPNAPRPSARRSLVQIGPAPMSVPLHGPAPIVVHGIVVDIADETACTLDGPCPIWYVVPSLHVEIIDSEPPGVALRVIDTLTRSPRMAALAPGPAPVPTTWHRVTFGGISVAVPVTWSVQNTSNWSSGCSEAPIVLDETGVQTGVTLDAGSTDIEPSCPALNVNGHLVAAPDSGLVIDPGKYGPLSSATVYAKCVDIHGLRVCPSQSDRFGFLVAAVDRAGGAPPVAIEIGLAGTGTTARDILRSVRPA